MLGRSRGKSDGEDNTPQIHRMFRDIPRGVEGRLHRDNRLPHQYFENPDTLAQIGFNDHAGDNFLGVINGDDEWVYDNGFREPKITGGVAVGSRDDRHRTLVAGSRSGKGRSVIVPELLTYAGSMIVIDPKGENAAITARYRAEKLKQKVCIIDPFGATPARLENHRKQFTPLTIVTPDNIRSVEDAGLIADALVVSNNPKDEHWTETAKAFIEGVILYVASSDNFTDKERTLLTVAELISGKRHDNIKGLLADMSNETILDNRIAAAAIAIKEKSADERGSVISTARKNLKFLDYSAMYSVLARHEFDLEDLKGEKPMTIYLVLPTTRMGTCKQLLRIFVNLTLAAVERVPTKPKYPVQMILDEMATLDKMKELENAIGQVAGLGLRITSVLQDLGQLKALYQNRYETFLGNSGILQFFGNVDYFTSKWISDYLGKTTIRYAQRNNRSVEAKQRGEGGLDYHTKTLELMTPEDVRRYFARGDKFNRQLVIIPGERPYMLQRANYDQHELFKGRFDKWR